MKTNWYKRPPLDVSKLQELSALEDELCSIAVTEIKDIVNYENNMSLRDRDAIKEVSELKQNTARTMLLMDRINKYVSTKNGTLSGSVGDRLPEGTEAEAKNIVNLAIERFNARNKG